MDKSVNKQTTPYSDFSAKSVDVASPFDGTKFGTQSVGIQLSVQAEAAYRKRDDKEWIAIGINLDQSYVTPGVLAKDQNDIRGYFLHRFGVMLWPQTREGQVSPDYAFANQFKYLLDAPKTQNGDGSISSSVSFGAGAQGGAMAGEAMAMGSLNFGIASSHSHQIKDFSFQSHGQGAFIMHSMTMSSSIDDAYDVTSLGDDLLHPWKQNPFLGARLDRLPDLAKSNAPITTQAYWISYDDDVVHRWPKVYIGVMVAAEYVLAEGTNTLGYGPAAIKAKHSVAQHSKTYLCPLDLSALRS